MGPGGLNAAAALDIKAWCREKHVFFNGEKTTINEKQTTNKGETDINDRTGTTLDIINDIFYK